MHRTGRSGKGAKGDCQNQPVGVAEQVEEGEENGTSGGVDSTESQGKEPTMSELISILRSHMGQQEAEEARRREEFTHQEQRFKALQHQFQLLQVEVQARTSPVPEPQMEEPQQPEVESFEEEDPPCAGSSNEQIHPQSGQSRFHEPRLEKLTICRMILNIF